VSGGQGKHMLDLIYLALGGGVFIAFAVYARLLRGA
jgi:hypothetical protein